MKARNLFFNLNMTSKSRNNLTQIFLLLAFTWTAFHFDPGILGFNNPSIGQLTAPIDFVIKSPPSGHIQAKGNAFSLRQQSGSQSEISVGPPSPVFRPSLIRGYLISRCSEIQPVVSPGQFVILILQKFNIWHQSSDDDPFFFPSSLS